MWHQSDTVGLLRLVYLLKGRGRKRGGAQFRKRGARISTSDVFFALPLTNLESTVGLSFSAEVSLECKHVCVPTRIERQKWLVYSHTYCLYLIWRWGLSVLALPRPFCAHSVNFVKLYVLLCSAAKANADCAHTEAKTSPQSRSLPLQARTDHISRLGMVHVWPHQRLAHI